MAGIPEHEKNPRGDMPASGPTEWVIGPWPISVGVATVGLIVVGLSIAVYGIRADGAESNRAPYVIGAFAVAGYILFRMRSMRRVAILGDRLHIASPFSRADIPLQELTDIIWIDRPTEPGDTPIAALILQRPCRFGDEIQFVPESVKLVEQLRAALPRRRLAVLPPSD